MSARLHTGLGPSFESASGLRPAAAFVVIAGTLIAVSGKATHISLAGEGQQPADLKSDSAPWPRFEINDRDGRPLAVSVECFDLTLSPHAMWRAHTPERMARSIAGALGDTSTEDLAVRLLPAQADHGELRVDTGGLLAFDRATRERVESWIATGAVDGAGGGRIEGLRVVDLGRGGFATLAWMPEVTLSEAMRERHVAHAAARPEVWTDKLLGDLATFVDERRLSPRLREELAHASERERGEILEDAIWAELMPSQFRLVRRSIEPETARELEGLLKREKVTPWQMRLECRLDRRHPLRPAPPAVGAEAELDAEDAFGVLGHWGVLDPGQALARARKEAGLREDEPYRDAREKERVEQRAHYLETYWQPWSGLELLCASELRRPEWGFLEKEPGTYARRVRNLPRDRKSTWNDDVPNYYVSSSAGSDAPRVVTTLDADLQRATHRALQGVMVEFDPALAMAIAVDVATGDVLAVDQLLRYPNAGFGPIRHSFTPGSTMKAIVMAIALEEGLVRPDDRFATYAPVGVVVRDAWGRGRLIREAEGAPTESHLEARRGLAESVNAVLVQIGLRIDPPAFRERLLRLGYGAPPLANLGPESGGYVPPLVRGTWKRRFTHASVSFGHEVSVTLWQHAAALATIARGGERLPLRLIRAVEQEDKRWEIPLEGGTRVLSQATCGQLRDMLALGARAGTGEAVAGTDACPELHVPGAYIGTKTGTTEKVETELCLHVELEHNALAHADGGPCVKSCREELRGQRAHKGIRRTCYTSSMCAIGRVGPDKREVLVLVVVEDPRSKKKFGRDVAGSSAIEILRRAVGLGPRPAAAVHLDTEDAELFNESDFPWAEEGESR